MLGPPASWACVRRVSVPLAAALLLAACGGGENGDPGGAEPPAAEAGALDTSLGAGSAGEPTVPDWVRSRLTERAGEDVAVLFATADHAVGRNRIGFVVVRPDNSLVQASRAQVLVAREGSSEAVEVAAALVPLGPHSHSGGSEPHDHLDVTDVYVAYADFPSPGTYWVVVEPDGEAIQGVGSVEVAEAPAAPAVGSKAIPSDNPTLAEAPAEEITTARPPDVELLRYSIRDSLAEGAPFVAVFATPKFCQSRACGPTVEVVDEVRQRFADSPIRFIHVEIFEGNDPQNGVNRWVEEWNLPTEPWVFIVDGRGIIRERFEGIVSVDELDAAVRNLL